MHRRESKGKIYRLVKILRRSIRAEAESGSKFYRVAPFLCA